MNSTNNIIQIKTMDTSPISTKRSDYYQYDSADMPFSPPTSSHEDFFYRHHTSSFTSDNKFTPLLKYVASSANTSNENVLENFFDEDQVVPGSLFMMENENIKGGSRRISQSLPATPLTTPATSPHTSPRLPRHDLQSESIHHNSSQIQNHNNLNPSLGMMSRNTRWLFHSFLPQQTADIVPLTKDTLEKERKDTISLSLPPPQAIAPRMYRKKCPSLSNRDMNFLAPTSM